jgi:DNA-binding NarL/FixJ family response regulator
MPLLPGLQTTAELHARRPGMRALILSVHVLKTAANCDLVAACAACMRGEPFPYPGAISALIRDYLERARRGEATPEDPLTPRELRVVKLIAEGSTRDDIAHLLAISKKTVDHHRANILEKLGLRNVAELTRHAIRRRD